MYQPITKWAHSIDNAASIPAVLGKAVKLAEAEKPGACVVELPEDIAKEEVSEPSMPVRKTRRAAADHKAVAQAVDAIASAKEPIVLAGNGAIRKRAAIQLARFAHKTGIAVPVDYREKVKLTQRLGELECPI